MTLEVDWLGVVGDNSCKKTAFLFGGLIKGLYEFFDLEARM